MTNRLLRFIILVMNAIMSIKQEYSQKILSGEKLFEFRKSAPLRATRIYIYETAPTKHIVGSFEFRIIKDTPLNLWERFGSFAGISEEGFFAYYKDAKIGIALEVINLRQEDINPYTRFQGFRPSQNFLYAGI